MNIKNTLSTNVTFLSSELRAAGFCSRFISVSVAGFCSQVLGTQDSINEIPVSLNLYRQLLENMKSPFLLNCRPVQCWFSFCSTLLGIFLVLMTSVSELAHVSHNGTLPLNSALTE